MKEMRPKNAKTMHLRNTTGSKKFLPRKSAAASITAPLMSEEIMKKHIKARRSSVTQAQQIFFEDVDIDDIHVIGANDILEKMKEYVNSEYLKRSKGIGRLKFKKLWKKVRGKELNEEKEKNELRKKFILEHLNEDQREMFAQELMEADIDDDDDMENNPKFEICPRLASKNQGTCKCQVLRSSDNWSTGIQSPESSILNAYLDCIKRAKKFIYIENQFFISNAGQGAIVKNPIAKALKNRIIDAHQDNEEFLVIVFIPLMPGFEGDVLKGDSAVLKTQIKYQQETISKGKNSLCHLLIEEGIEPSDYIKFYGLRQHDLFTNDVPKSEIIYIHSKLMIVDDRQVIIGSANINDRSMLGTRDSEIAILIEDEDVFQSKMGGKPFMVGRMPHAFRTQLFMGKLLQSSSF